MLKLSEAFPDFEQIGYTLSLCSPQFTTRNPVLYPAELRGQTVIHDPITDGRNASNRANNPTGNVTDLRNPAIAGLSV